MKALTVKITKATFNIILKYEIVSRKYYEKHLKHPIYPGGSSGVTIGIGYDLGYVTISKFKLDWGDLLSRETFDTLSRYTNLKHSNAKRAINKLRHIDIEYEAALSVFKSKSLPHYSSIMINAFGTEVTKLPPAAQGMLLSLIYNRGGRLTGSTRKEMKRISELVPSGDLRAIARQVRKMKRLWVGKGLDGLLKRRDREAYIISTARFDIPEKDLILIEVPQ